MVIIWRFAGFKRFKRFKGFTGLHVTSAFRRKRPAAGLRYDLAI